MQQATGVDHRAACRNLVNLRSELRKAQMPAGKAFGIQRDSDGKHAVRGAERIVVPVARLEIAGLIACND